MATAGVDHRSKWLSRHKRLLRYFAELCAAEALTYVDEVNIAATEKVKTNHEVAHR
jgi:hypothetical protein